ncbi:hypothetical protein [Streptomyces sp. NBC_01304]|uniref:hypothetical protein n=1 Tax=Streptomyces sp. NBC_01304 TaxID=2903818 RepID=UPI002E14444A|nr:hypothetical protein OG430_23940 [Streptomyces sp. NBC_01304]
MVALTPMGNLPYPQPTDAANVPLHLQSLAEAVDGRTVLRFTDAADREAKVKDPVGGMVAWLNNPGRLFYYHPNAKVWAPVFPNPSHWYNYRPNTTASATYVEIPTEPLSVGFLAPPSGTVLITLGARMSNSAASTAYLSAAVKQSSTVVSAADDARAAVVQGTNLVSASIQYPVSGLTPGLTYTVTGAYRSAAATNTATFVNRFVTVAPMG